MFWKERKKLALLPTKCHLLFAHTRERHKSFIFTMARHKRERIFPFFSFMAIKKIFTAHNASIWSFLGRKIPFIWIHLRIIFGGLALVVKGLIWRNLPSAYQAWGTESLGVQGFFFLHQHLSEMTSSIRLNANWDLPQTEPLNKYFQLFLLSTFNIHSAQHPSSSSTFLNSI